MKTFLAFFYRQSGIDDEIRLARFRAGRTRRARLAFERALDAQLAAFERTENGRRL